MPPGQGEEAWGRTYVFGKRDYEGKFCGRGKPAQLSVAQFCLGLWSFSGVDPSTISWCAQAFDVKTPVQDSAHTMASYARWHHGRTKQQGLLKKGPA